MPEDKSLFYYGSLYHRIIDGKLREARQVIVDLIPEGAYVLDIGCGTGELCFDLRRDKGCRVAGVDLSRKMIDFAKKNNVYPEVRFVHGDATNLTMYSDHSFDFAIMLVFIHELEPEQQRQALQEALRVADKLIICESVSPLPKNKGGLLIWLAETVFGYEHKRHFKRFLALGGIKGLLKESGLPLKFEYSKVFWHGAREVAVVSY